MYENTHSALAARDRKTTIQFNEVTALARFALAHVKPVATTSHQLELMNSEFSWN